MTFKESSAKLSMDANQRIKEKEYWLSQLSGDLAKSAFPYDRKAASPNERRLDSVSFEFTGNIFTRLMKLSNKSDIRLHIILMAALVGLFNKYTTQEDIIVGAPIIKQEVEGDFINTVLILRSQLKSTLTFKEMLLQLSKTMAEVNEHVNYPIETLLYQLNIPYSKDEFPLFDMALLLKNIHAKKDIQHLNLNMLFSFSRKEGVIEAEVEYNSLTYNKASIERIVTHYKRYVETALSNIEIMLESIDILSETEKKQLLFDFNDTEAEYPDDKNIHQLFEEQVERTPGHMALVHEEKSKQTMTYRELNKKSNQLARILSKKGIGKDSIAALLMERSIEMIIGVLGVLKAGGGYLPMDIDYPDERIKFMFEDSNAELLLTAGVSSEKAAFTGNIVCVENEEIYQNENNTTNLANHTSPEDLCYIIYTSGTTGKPKGVMVEHRNVVRLMFNNHFLFDFNGTDAWTMFHSYCFDFSVWEMYGALLYGGKLVVIPRMVAKDPKRYLEILKQEEVTVLNQTPSAFYNLANEELKSRGSDLFLKYVIFGGEALKPVMLKAWKARYPETRFINMYGITETTVHVTYKEITEVEIEKNSSNIGSPIPTLSSYIMDQHQRLLPLGAPGEICVGGEGVGRGYLNRLELSEMKFVKNPYKPDKRLYKTGDLGRLSGNGEMEYLGRIDTQVKIRAHRIELGELESQLLKFEPVKDAVVVAHEDREGDRQLVAYVVPHPERCFPVRQLIKLEKLGFLKNHRYYDLPNGMTTFYLNQAETDFMYREIFEKNSYMQHGITLEQGACVFDVGANIGIFSLLVNKRCKNAKIFAFEPIPPIFEVLALNASIYDEGENIKIFQYGLSDSEGEVTFTYYPNATVLSGRFANDKEEMKNVKSFMRHQPSFEEEDMGIADNQWDELLENRLITNPFNCQLKTLSQVIKESKVERIDLLKIDVEKSEIDVLKGIDEEDWPRIRQIVIEVHNVGGRLDVIVDLLEKKGYKVVFEQETELEDTDLYNVYAWLPQKAQPKEKEKKAPGFEATWNSTEHLIDDIRGFLKKKLPDYMIPSHFMLLEQLPVTPNGKVDRKALPELEVKTGGGYEPPKDDTERKLVKIWAEVLNVDENVIGRNSDFFDLGGHSLMAVQLVSQMVKDFDVTVTKIFEYNKLSELASNISFKKDNLKEKFERIKRAVKLTNESPQPNPLDAELKEKYQEYLESFKKENLILPGSGKYQNTLLTGATGYLGAYLVHELLKYTDGTLYLLVRGSSVEEAEARLKVSFVFYFGDDFYETVNQRLVVVKGDLKENNLGIAPAYYLELTKKIDVVVHAAANVIHFAQYEDLFKDNVEGTERVLQFAVEGKKKDFHYMSTISVGVYDCPLKLEEDMLFTEYSPAKAHLYDENVYVRSKCEAEKRVCAYREKGLNASIYRVGNLSFHSETGKFQKNIESNGFYTIMKGYIMLGAVPNIHAFSLGHMSFIDYLARAVVLIMTKVQFENETFHVYNDQGLFVKDLSAYFDRLEMGINVKRFEIEAFLDYLETSMEDEKKRPLIELLILHTGIFERFTREGGIKLSTVVKEKTDRILRELGFKWHSLSDEQFKMMIMHCKEVGFID